MAEYLRVKNWQQFQHYKHRNPPWIKLHQSLLDDYDFARLPDASKLLALCIWLLAARTENKIPHDCAWIQSRCNLKSKPDCKILIDSGFIECYQDASKTLATCVQSADPETEKSRDRVEIEKTNSSEPLNGVCYIPLVGKKEWAVDPQFLSELELAYPAVDGLATLLEIRAWCLSNPTKCKTERGIKRFINRWFERTQNA